MKAWESNNALRKIPHGFRGVFGVDIARAN